MKNAPTKALILLSTALLSSCGAQTAQDSQAKKTEYFDAYKTASRAGYASGAYSVASENLQAQAGVKILRDDEEYSFTLTGYALPFDFAIKGYEGESVSGVSAFGELNSASLTITTDLSDFGATLSKLEPKIYLQDSTVYVDTSKNKTIGTLVQTAIREIPGNENWKYPSTGKGKIGLNEDQSEAVDGLYSDFADIDSLIDSSLDLTLDLMERAYQADPTSFAFSSTGSEKKIGFTTKDKTVIQSVLQNKIEDEVGEREGFDETSFEQSLAKAFEGVSLEKLRYDVSFNDQGLVSKDVYFNATADESKFEESFPDLGLYPSGNYFLKGTFDYAFGDTVTVQTVPSPETFEDFQSITF